MTIFDPYDNAQPTHPGLNTGGQMQVSTLGPVATDGPPSGRYRSGALSALAPFLGWVSILLSAWMGLGAFTARMLCLDGRLDAAACTAEPTQLVLAPVAVLVFGLVLAAIAGSLAKRRRAFGSIAVLAGAAIGLIAVIQWFSGTLLGLPFP